MTLCYLGLGWSVVSQYDYDNTNGGSDALSLTTLDLKKANQRGVVYFSAFGVNGRSVQPPRIQTRLDIAKRSLRMAIGLFDVVKESNQLGIRPISQIQVFESRPSNSTISENDFEELKSLFVHVRKLLLEKVKSGT